MKINVQTLQEINKVNNEIEYALKRFINTNLVNPKSSLKIIPCKFLLFEDFPSEEEFIYQEMNQQNYVGIRNIGYSDDNVHYSVYGEYDSEEFEYSFYTKLENLIPFISEKFL